MTKFEELRNSFNSDVGFPPVPTLVTDVTSLTITPYLVDPSFTTTTTGKLFMIAVKSDVRLPDSLDSRVIRFDNSTHTPAADPFPLEELSRVRIDQFTVGVLFSPVREGNVNIIADYYGDPDDATLSTVTSAPFPVTVNDAFVPPSTPAALDLRVVTSDVPRAETGDTITITASFNRAPSDLNEVTFIPSVGLLENTPPTIVAAQNAVVATYDVTAVTGSTVQVMVLAAGEVQQTHINIGPAVAPPTPPIPPAPIAAITSINMSPSPDISPSSTFNNLYISFDMEPTDRSLLVITSNNPLVTINSPASAIWDGASTLTIGGSVGAALVGDTATITATYNGGSPFTIMLTVI